MMARVPERRDHALRDCSNDEAPKDNEPAHRGLARTYSAETFRRGVGRTERRRTGSARSVDLVLPVRVKYRKSQVAQQDMQAWRI